MSSIMRRRRGLISAIGGSCLWIGLRQPQSCQTGDLPHDDPPYLPRKRVSSIPGELPRGSSSTGWKTPKIPVFSRGTENLDVETGSLETGPSASRRVAQMLHLEMRP